jgi:hypothetical protein
LLLTIQHLHDLLFLIGLLLNRVLHEQLVFLEPALELQDLLLANSLELYVLLYLLLASSF